MTTHQNEYFKIEENDADTDHRTYHSRLRLLHDNWQVMTALKGATAFGENHPIDSTLELVLGIPGVIWAQVCAYKVDIKKSPVFSWGEIDLHMLPLWMGIKLSLDETSEATVDVRKYLLRSGLI